MGTAIGELLPRQEIRLEAFANKTIAVDAFNTLYQFLSALRSADGSLLTDRQGNVTSHLNGLLTRCVALLEKNIRLVFVFDGIAPALKEQEKAKRQQLKQQAAARYQQAVEEEDLASMAKYSARTVTMTEQILTDAKRLLAGLGIPSVDAPSEGEAQAAALLAHGHVDAIASQDYDALLFGADVIVRNLAVSPRKKKPGAYAYERLHPERIDKHAVLAHLGISHRQLIALALLVGTDFNPGGIKGIGPQKALKLVKAHGEDFSSLFAAVSWDRYFPYPWEEVYALFLHMPVHSDVQLVFGKPDEQAVLTFLCDERDFSKERVFSELQKLSAAAQKPKQKGLADFF
ncbi:MAG: flap endonuclease-1 [Candidatus Woesearchaeota archaeon]